MTLSPAWLSRVLAMPAFMTAASLITFGEDTSPASVKAIAHRGEHLSHVENTLPAFQAAIDAGADYFECDVRTTADGHLVLMHDAAVDRTMDGKGTVRDLTMAQIRALSAGGSRVPTFAEALELAKGRAGVYVDNKQAKPLALVKEIDEAGMGDQILLYVSPSEAKETLALRPGWKLMAEAGNASRLRQLIDSLHLRAAAFDDSDFNPETIRIAKERGVEIYVDRLGPRDNQSGWQSAIDAGAAGIQTDHPGELVLYLRSKYRHK
jgi:glycerophosphoryl diester phosphodiesterase